MRKDNLIPMNRRTKEEQRRIASMGGKASAEARRRRKTLTEALNALLASPVTDKKDFNKAIKAGIDVEDLDKSQMIVIALYEKAKSGDVAALKELRRWTGEDDGADEIEDIDAARDEVFNDGG